MDRFMAKLKDSTYTEWHSIYLLTGEIMETERAYGFTEPLPCVASELAARCALVLSDPLNKMYGKVNRFLQKGPVGNIDKLLTYWVDKTLLQEPDYDDSHWVEMDWLVDLLVHGLRSQKDMELYRQAGIFERLLALYNAPNISQMLKKKILNLIYRSTLVEGSTSLVTRAAIISWLQSQFVSQDKDAAILKKMVGEIWAKSDRRWVDAWGGEDLQLVVAQIAQVVN